MYAIRSYYEIGLAANEILDEGPGRFRVLGTLEERNALEVTECIPALRCVVGAGQGRESVFEIGRRVVLQPAKLPRPREFGRDLAA